MIKVGLVGFGGIGSVHFDSYKNIANAQVVAVADVRTDLAKEKLGENEENIRIYSSMEDLLANEEVDMVDICTPTYMHADMSVSALKSGVNVMCEKPMALSSKDTQRMVDAAEGTDKIFMIGHVVRFMKPYMYLKCVVDSGELGKPLQLEFKRLSHIPEWSWEDWMRDRSKSGGSLVDLSIHDLDYVQYVFGKPQKVSSVYRKLKDNSDFLVSELIYDGMVATVSGAFYTTPGFPFKAEYLAVFENGYVEYRGGKIVKNGEEINLKESDSKASGINLPDIGGHQYEIQYFVDCVEKGIKPDVVTPEDAQDTIKLIERLLDNCTEI